MKTLFILITTSIISVLFPTSQSQTTDSFDCNAELSVDKNRHFRSADKDGTIFMVILKNTSSKTTTFELSSKNLTTPCVNNKKRRATPNVDLDVVLQANNLSRASNNEITLTSGQDYKFAVKVSVPDGTPFNTWSCIEIEAISKDCKSSIAQTVLNVYVPDPSEK